MKFKLCSTVNSISVRRFNSMVSSFFLVLRLDLHNELDEVFAFFWFSFSVNCISKGYVVFTISAVWNFFVDLYL